ncbi:hypothetical protein HPT27_13175 [Permianibacter sp. IMCC34836]|uniref:DUF6629 family protein n=1 Tax=Permianibacter fluminis TaxID=2738515 RepID=UPI001552C991|nr:DUF6629 family protein [Permianibacter fluminis]NQD37977.1 hypothetical protein [Permianibacter fluminis]
MCFSATASFTAGVALSVIGIATLRLVKRPAEFPMAMIPFLFSLQQVSEGLVWLNLQQATTLASAWLIFFYSLFSHVIWPIFVPFAVGRIELVPWRKKALWFCQLVGWLVGLYLLSIIVRFPVKAIVQGGHIAYESPHFYLAQVVTLYLIATCVSGLLSSHRFIRAFGAMALASSLAAYAIHSTTWISVWCFFAAVLSAVIWWHFRKASAEHR